MNRFFVKSLEKFSFPNLTAVMIFHHEWFDVYRCLSEFKKFYPNGQVILARDSLKPIIPNFLEEFDPIAMESYECMQKLVELNWNLEKAADIPLEVRYEIANLQLKRLFEAASLSVNEHLLALEYDAHIRRKIPIYFGVDVESLEINPYKGELLEFVENLSGKKFPLVGYGFVVGTFSRSSAINAYTWFLKNKPNVMKLLELDYRLVYLDCLFPIFAHLGGASVANNDLTSECKRDKLWKFRKTPLVHQFRSKKLEHRDYAKITL